MRILALMALTLTFLGCGGAPPPPVAQQPAAPPGPPPGSTEVHARGERQVTATVGSAGGTLEIDNGARLTIPPNALSETREITFGRGADTRVFDNREGIRPLSGTLTVSPPLITAPGKPVTVSIPHRGLPDGYDAADLALAVESAGERRALGMGENQTRWENFPAVQRGDRLEGELTELPGMRLAFIVSR